MVVLHLVALLIPLTFPWPAERIGIAMGLVIAHGIWLRWRLNRWPREISFTPEGAAVIKGVSRRVVSARRLPFAVQLVLEARKAEPRTVLLMQDALSPKDFHALCARIEQQQLPVRERAAHR